MPPARNSHVEGSAAVLTEWGREFDLEDVQEGEMAMVEGLPSLDDEEGAQVESMGAPALEPLEAMEEEDEGSEDGMDEGEGGTSACALWGCAFVCTCVLLCICVHLCILVSTAAVLLHAWPTQG